MGGSFLIGELKAESLWPYLKSYIFFSLYALAFSNISHSINIYLIYMYKDDLKMTPENEYQTTQRM